MSLMIEIQYLLFWIELASNFLDGLIVYKKIRLSTLILARKMLTVPEI
jgi:hypothetical protein